MGASDLLKPVPTLVGGLEEVVAKLDDAREQLARYATDPDIGSAIAVARRTIGTVERDLERMAEKLKGAAPDHEREPPEHAEHSDEYPWVSQ